MFREEAVAEKAIDGLARYQRKDVRVTPQAIVHRQRDGTPLQSLVARELGDRGAEHESNRTRQLAPVISIPDTQVPLVATEELVGSLADQRHLDVPPGPLA